MTTSELPAALRPVPWVEQMAAYEAPDDVGEIAERAGVALSDLVKLDANENPYGPSPRVKPALADYSGYHLYPDPDQRALRQLTAAYAGVDASHVILGNGSDEIIDLLCRIYLAPGDEIIDNTPTFGMYRFSTAFCGGRVVEAPRDENWWVDVAAVERAITERTRMIFVATPNNPSGNLEGERTVRALLDTGRIVVLDEAYLEFAGAPSFARLVGQHQNLVVLRTFSKWSGLAGLRVGYGILPQHMLAHLWKVKPPFNVNLAAEVAVRATLADPAHTQRAVAALREERERMIGALGDVEGIHVWPSSSNFVLLRVAAPGAASLKAFLASRGIAIRAYSHPRLQDCVRISVGRPSDTDAVLAAVWTWRELN
jgi:histidinol-phosphate aminotransferase